MKPWELTPAELDAAGRGIEARQRKPPTPRQQRMLEEMDQEAAAGMGMSVEDYRTRFEGIDMEKKTPRQKMLSGLKELGAGLGGVLKEAAHEIGTTGMAEFRAGLKDLQQVVLSPLEGSMATVSEPGTPANPVQMEVYEERHPTVEPVRAPKTPQIEMPEREPG